MALMSQRQSQASKWFFSTEKRSNMRSLLLTGFAMLMMTFFLSTTISAQNTPILKVVTPFAACGGFNTHVFIDVDTLGNQVAGAGFSINFNPSILTNPVVTLGSDAQAAGFASLGTPPSSNSLNFSNVANGQIGMILDSGGSLPTTPGDKRMVVIRFDIVNLPPPGLTPITFGGSPTLRSISDPGGNLYTPFTSQDGNLMVGGTACTTSAGVTVSGRVTTARGQGLRSAEVFMTDTNGNRRKVLTSSLGYYQFEDVDAGQTYIMGVSSRRYRFTSRALQVSDNLADVDFVGID